MGPCGLALLGTASACCGNVPLSVGSLGFALLGIALLHIASALRSTISLRFGSLGITLLGIASAARSVDLLGIASLVVTLLCIALISLASPCSMLLWLCAALLCSALPCLDRRAAWRLAHVTSAHQIFPHRLLGIALLGLPGPCEALTHTALPCLASHRLAQLWLARRLRFAQHRLTAAASRSALACLASPCWASPCFISQRPRTAPLAHSASPCWPSLLLHAASPRRRPLARHGLICDRFGLTRHCLVRRCTLLGVDLPSVSVIRTMPSRLTSPCAASASFESVSWCRLTCRQASFARQRSLLARLALPCLASPRLAWRRLASPCPASAGLASPCLVLPRLVVGMFRSALASSASP